MAEITVYGLPGIGDAPSMSPFVVKVETWLRFAGVPYRRVDGDPNKAPRGKMPWISLDGEKIPDSERIIDTLERRLDDPLDDARLTAAQRTTGHLLRRTLEDGLYWIVVHTRWASDEEFARLRAVFRGLLPPVVRTLVPPLVRRKILKATHVQGAARLDPDERLAFARRDVEALRHVLGDGPYLFGDAPSRYDAVAYGLVCQALAASGGGAIFDLIRGDDALTAYGARVRASFWSDEAE